MYMTANVPRMENGSAMLGISVAEALRRNTKITMITRARVTNMVVWTSWKASRMFFERSLRRRRCTAGGSCDWKNGIRRDISLVTSMVLLPGWRMTMRFTARSVLSGVLIQELFL